MDIMLRQKDVYRRMYNCNFYSLDMVPLEKRKHPAYGTFLITLFIIFEVLYAPCVFAMLQKKLRKHFCYRLMTVMGIYDMLLLPTNAFLPGVASLYGYEYCSFPVFYYIVGDVLCSLWIGYAFCALTLAFNRCLQFSAYSWIFEGKKWESFWIAVPFVVTLYMFVFGRTCTYSVVTGALFFNSHIDYFPDIKNEYPTYIHTVVNLSFSFLVPGVYIYYFKNNYHLARNRPEGITKHEYSLFFQLFGINATIASAAFFTALLQYIELPPYLMIYTHLSWVFISGTPPLVYLAFNKSIQAILLRKFFGHRINPTNASRISQLGKEEREHIERIIN